MKQLNSSNILVLTYWSYKDALIQTYTLPYVRLIKKNLPPNAKVYLVTLEQLHLKMSANEMVAEKNKLLAEGIYLRSVNYNFFGVKALLTLVVLFSRLLYLCITRKIYRIHAWCTPAGSLGYILSIFTGISLLIDSYEPHAESMVENGTWKRNSMVFKLLFFLEKLQSRKAKVVIATSKDMRDYSKKMYGVEHRNFYVKPACIDMQKFSVDNFDSSTLRKELGFDNKIICVYAGKIGGIYLEQEIFNFFKVAFDYWDKKFSVVLLTATSPFEMADYIKTSGLNPDVLYTKFVSHDDVPYYMSIADFAINPVKPVPTKKYCTSIKDGEYWAMGLPVIIPPDISEDSDIIEKNKIGSVIRNFTYEGYYNSVKEIDEILKNNDRNELRGRSRMIARKYRSFEIAENIYKAIYCPDGTKS